MRDFDEDPDDGVDGVLVEAHEAELDENWQPMPNCNLHLGTLA